MKKFAYMLFCILFSLIFSGCAGWNSDTKHAACNLLKSKLVFNGSTSDDRQAEIENAEQPLDQRTYDKNCE